MNNLDFNYYSIEVSALYDGFIDTNGNYYRVKEKGTDDITHDLWSQQYLKKINNFANLEFNFHTSTFLDILNINNFTDILVNLFGFVYYNHDSVFQQPIIKFPNPEIANNKITDSQLESLFKIMIINNEDPYHKEFLINANMFYYNGLEEGCAKK